MDRVWMTYHCHDFDCLHRTLEGAIEEALRHFSPSRRPTVAKAYWDDVGRINRVTLGEDIVIYPEKVEE